ncbi:hypothetical protein Vadar_016036 [Vaccinium darrowii]|uniref:Uncharacterized protein n=1 Tax=Vaccinium darrowii TaxID=229202 RepID=A0ACB7ZCY7_9ERIC|nr:hypothetical protein Vadar_016036 [Vaccinium darrowii]
MAKINFDGAFVPSLNVGGVGVVARADDGSFLFARSRGGLKARSAIVMEGLALRVGVLLAKEQGIRRVVFEGDAKGLIDVLNEPVMQWHMNWPKRDVVWEVAPLGW